jgi:hypothetical protein
VRFQATAKDLILFHLRIDADFAQPHGGFAPIDVTYAWEESGNQKRDAHTARSPGETYKITCSEKPRMESLTLQRAD